mgnify:CR=1 FL=1
MEIRSELKSDILPKALQALNFADEEQIAFLLAKLLKIIEKSTLQMEMFYYLIIFCKKNK